MTAATALLERARRVGWRTAPIWTIAKRVDRVGFPDAELLSVYRDWGVVRKSDREDNFNVESDDLSSYKFVKPGDLVLNKMKTWQGSLAVSDHEGIVSPAYFTCELAPTVYPRFIHYLLRSDPYIAMYAAASKGIRPNQWDLPYDEFRSIPAVLPTLEEQRRIADFLDEQVARMDQVVVKRRRQIAFIRDMALAETYRLTEGDPSQAIWRIGLAFDTGSGTTPSSDRPEYFDGDVPWVCSGDLNDGRLSATARNVTSEALASYSALKVHPAGSLLVAMYGATVGKTALLEVDASVNQAVCVLRPRGPIDPEFAQYWMIARRNELLTLAAGSGQPNISQEIVRSLRLRVGDRAWQKERLSQMRAMALVADSSATALSKSIELLHEYKRSLITAAVTGELDVTSSRPEVPA